MNFTDSRVFYQHTELVTNVGIKDFPGDRKITCSKLFVSVGFDPAIYVLSVNYLTFNLWVIACADTENLKWLKSRGILILITYHLSQECTICVLAPWRKYTQFSLLRKFIYNEILWEHFLQVHSNFFVQNITKYFFTVDNNKTIYRKSYLCVFP